MVKRQRFTAEFKREAVRLLDAAKKGGRFIFPMFRVASVAGRAVGR